MSGYISEIYVRVHEIRVFVLDHLFSYFWHCLLQLGGEVYPVQTDPGISLKEQSFSFNLIAHICSSTEAGNTVRGEKIKSLSWDLTLSCDNLPTLTCRYTQINYRAEWQGVKEF